MHFDQIMSPRRLADFLAFTQRYRILMVAVGLVWLVAVILFRLPVESGPAGVLVLGVIIACMGIAVLTLPRVARWWTRNRGYGTVYFYGLCLVLDTLVVSATVPLTGGGLSMSFAFYYFLAIGNCYAFRGRSLFLANTFVAVTYVAALLSMSGTPYAARPLDWADILAVRIPLIYFVSYYAQWLARRGDLQVQEDQKQYLSTLQGLLTALEARDGYTKQHSSNVGGWGAVMAQELGLSVDDQEVLLHACELHDIGKIGVPDAILNKPGRLTPEEFAVMKSHPQVGVEITEHIAWFTADHLAVVHYHHEKWDGTGYPAGLKGEEIPYLARIATLCDVFDAMTNDRPYRAGMPATKAMAIMEDGVGSHFDPVLSRRFLRLVENLLTCLRRETGAEDFNAVTWDENGARLRILGPEGSAWVTVQYQESGWQLVSEPVDEPLAS